jgi:NAD(P)-dependent dehydrogenase (short-subunit alcohol dehydrogenase family)
MNDQTDAPVILITGATDGIGRAAALRFARAGCYLLIHGRDEDKLRATARLLEAQPGSVRVDWLPADFASLSQVRALCDYLTDNYDRIDALINNVGTLSQTREVSADGFERTFAVNYLAPVLLTQRLLPVLRDTAGRVGEARVVNVSANGHLKVTLDFDDLQSANGYGGVVAYQRSKLAQVLWTKWLARELAGSGVTVNAVHPGVLTTKVLMAGFGITGADPDEGGAVLEHMARASDLRGVSGRYFDQLRERKGVAAAQDLALQERLHEVTQVLVT